MVNWQVPPVALLALPLRCRPTQPTAPAHTIDLPAKTVRKKLAVLRKCHERGRSTRSRLKNVSNLRKAPAESTSEVGGSSAYAILCACNRDRVCDITWSVLHAIPLNTSRF